MGKSPCCKEVGLKKGPWKPEEDQKLIAYIERHGHGSWRTLPAKAGLQRCGKSCRLRWTNYLRPDIRRGNFSLQEEQTIIQLHALLGNRWSAIAAQLPKRTDNEIKNYWNTHLKKRLTKMGIDPVTHKPKSNALGSSESKDTANLNHIAQWESARVEAEARLVRGTKLHVSNPYHPPTASSLRAHPLSKAFIPLPCHDILKAWQGFWTKKPNNAYLNSNVENLESPTSVLHFSDNMQTDPSTGFAESSNFPKARKSNPPEVVITKEEIQKCLDKSNKEVDEMLLHGIGSFPVDVACIADTLGLPSFTDGVIQNLLSDDAGDFNINSGLYDNFDSCCSGNLEDNKKYWNGA